MLHEYKGTRLMLIIIFVLYIKPLYLDCKTLESFYRNLVPQYKINARIVPSQMWPC